MHARAVSIAVAAALAGTPAAVAADDPPTVHAQVELVGNGWVGDNCTGGDWSLRWSDQVAVEPGSYEDLLISHTAFDTTQPGQESLKPADFRANRTECRDDDGNVVLTGTIVPKGANEVAFNVSLNPDTLNSPAINFSADELGTCRIDAAGFPPSLTGAMVAIHTGGGVTSISPALDITLEDLERGFDKSYTFHGNVIGAAPICMGAELKKGTLRLRYKSGEDDPTVAMDACLHLARGEVREVQAAGSPDGGLYRYTSKPGHVLRVAGGGGPTATVTGETPGKGTVTVEYTRNGRSASATVEGSVVQLISVNGGKALPKLGLYGVNGLHKRETYDFPIVVNPRDGLLDWEVASEAMASAVSTSTKLSVQPLRLGETQLQAKTICGTPVGGPVYVTIVLCDEDVKQQLRARQTELRGQIDAITKRITRLLADDEFQRAATEIKATTGEFAIKAGESIVGTLTFGQGQRLDFAKQMGVPISRVATVNQQTIEITGTMWDGLNAMGDINAAVADPNDWNAVAKAALGVIVLAAQNQAIALGKTYGETYLATKKFGQDLGIIAGVVEQLENLEPQLDALVREHVRITTRLHFCEQTQPPPKPTEPKPQPPKPTPPPTEIPIEYPVEIPVDEAPEQPPPPEPLPPSTEPGRNIVALACRIPDLAAPAVAQRFGAIRGLPAAGAAHEELAAVNRDTTDERHAELATLKGYRVEMQAVQRLAEQQRAAIEQAQSAVSDWQRAIDAMKAAMEGTAAQRKDAASTLTRSYDHVLLKGAEAGGKTIDSLMAQDGCRDRIEVRIDQVRARYN